MTVSSTVLIKVSRVPRVNRTYRIYQAEKDVTVVVMDDILYSRTIQD